ALLGRRRLRLFGAAGEAERADGVAPALVLRGGVGKGGPLRRVGLRAGDALDLREEPRAAAGDGVRLGLREPVLLGRDLEVVDRLGPSSLPVQLLDDAEDPLAIRRVGVQEIALLDGMG